MTGMAGAKGKSPGAAAGAQVEAEALARLEPGPEEVAAVQDDTRRLLAAAQAALDAARLPARATVQGSIAKRTWLAGAADTDLFLLADPSWPEARLEELAEAVARAVLREPRKKYAQHPYLVGSFGGRMVDVVPAYAVAAAAERMSAVDRTPFHTAWVLEHVDEGLRRGVRLLKGWLKGVGCYGAQTAVGGFSGYLAEVLAVRFGSFAAALDWLAGGANPTRIVLGPDRVPADAQAALTVVDPVDPKRNCSAAVLPGTLQRAVDAARAYRQAPSPRFFFPAPPREESPARLAAALAQADESWAGVLLHPRALRMDIVFPQFQRAGRTLDAALEDAGFEVRAAEVLLHEPDEVLLQWRCAGSPLPERRLHRGPRDDGRSNAARFREKWEGHPDAAGPVTAGPDGHLEVELAVRHRTPMDWLGHRAAAVALGRHAGEAMKRAQAFDDPAALPPHWRPAAADFILGRQPWER